MLTEKELRELKALLKERARRRRARRLQCYNSPAVQRWGRTPRSEKEWQELAKDELENGRGISQMEFGKEIIKSDKELNKRIKELEVKSGISLRVELLRKRIKLRFKKRLSKWRGYYPGNNGGGTSKRVSG